MLLWMIVSALVMGVSLGTLGFLVLREVLDADDEDDRDSSRSSSA